MEKSGCNTHVPQGCDCRPKQYLTDEEAAILTELHQMKLEARALIHRIEELSQVSSSNPEITGLKNRLEELKAQWGTKGIELDAANQDKLIRLGHREIAL